MDPERRCFIRRTDCLLERLERLALDSVQPLPSPLRRELAALAAELGYVDIPPRRVTQAHEWLLDLLELEMPRGVATG